jgi:hypothetical protein
MQDRELLRMAAFKLQETAKRLDSLASETEAEVVRAHLRQLARDLRTQEVGLWTLVADGAHGGQPEAMEPADPAPGRQRNRAAS